MGKLFKLKKFVTLEAAANYIEAICEEPVSVTDVLRFALDGHLRLSVRFVNEAPAKNVKIISESEIYDEETHTGLTISPIQSTNFKILSDGRYLRLYKSVSYLRDIWDLAMVGDERLEVERLFQSLTCGPSITHCDLNGVFVERYDGAMYQLQTQNHPGSDNYSPALRFPEDSELVVRLDELTKFEQILRKSKSGIIPEETEIVAELAQKSSLHKASSSGSVSAPDKPVATMKQEQAALVTPEAEELTITTAEGAAKSNGIPTIPEWIVESVRLADEEGLRIFKTGSQEITTRRVCDAVATKLGKIQKYHGNRGPRSAGTVRNVALMGWKFIYPSDTNGIIGTNE